MAKSKIFNKTAALVIAIVLVFCFAASATAEIAFKTTVDYSNYNVGTPNDVTVKVDVTGVTAGSDVAYQAKKVSDGTDVFVDQKTADASGKVSFTIDTDKANLNINDTNNTNVSVADETMDTALSSYDGLRGYTVTHGAEEKIPAANGVVEFTVPYSYGGVIDTYEIAPADGAVVESVTLTPVDSTNATLKVTLTQITKNITVTYTEKAIELDQDPISTFTDSGVTAGVYVDNYSAEDLNAVLVVVIYDDNGAVLKYDFKPITVSAGVTSFTDQFTVNLDGITLNGTTPIGYAKSFFWDCGADTTPDLFNSTMTELASTQEALKQ